MPQRHVVVDGSNLATEGRSLPSLAQLDQAVREFLGEFPDDIVTVVVDASFAHRIDSSEVATFEEAEAAGEVVSPPAGAIGRGDAFLLRIADKTGATVLSNDSFQEFHGEHEWLFEPDRLVGGKPVPGVGWIFTPRTPVRGPKSREAVKEAKRKKRAESDDGSASGLDLAASRGRGRGKKVERAIATATEEAVEPSDSKKRRRRKNSEPPSDPINEPLAFITFIAGHPLGSQVEGTVESFSSHGAFVDADGARCYVPLSAMGVPAPRSAREVMNRGETREFVIQALDPLRRGIELALPGFAKLAGAPTDETVEAETHPVSADDQVERAPAKAAASAKKVGARRRPAVMPPLAEGEDRGDRPAIGASKAAPPLRRPRTPATAAADPPHPAAPPVAPGPEELPGPADIPAAAPTPTAPPPGDGVAPVPADVPPAKAPSRRRTAKKSPTPEPELVGTETPAAPAEAVGTSGGTGPAQKAAAVKRGARKPEPPAEKPGLVVAEPSREATKRGGTRKGATKAPAGKAPAKRAAAAKAPTSKAAASLADQRAKPASPRKAAAKATSKQAAPGKAAPGKAAPAKAAPGKAA
ncbi:MAG: S1 RNA-binding domain-containing protein, partial [Actinomycetota bacterium]|nr:S1 RNA-binding domain-containing protein [Actinomycetota bacterium]